MDYVLKEMALFSAIGIGLNYAFSSVFPADLIKGDPRWMYYLGVCYQSTIFPYFCFRSWATKRSLKEWLTLPWSKLDVTFDKLYMGCIWGYWFKDMANLSDPLIVVHHIACMTCLLLCIGQQKGPGIGYFVAGTCVLELGTAAYNYNNITTPPTIFSRYLYYIVMALSNLIAVAMAIHYARSVPASKAIKITYFLVIVGLCIGRQREAILDYLKY